MDKDEAGEANTPGETEEEVRRWGSDEPIRVVPGREFDTRPDPAGVHKAEDTQMLRLPPAEDLKSGGLVHPAPRQSLWPDANTTGAFVSAAASIRHEVAPRRWWNVTWWMILLWGLVVGVPALGAAWAVWVIWSEVHSAR